MAKTLTEQWKDGKLKFGKTYWCCDKEKNIARLVNMGRKFFEWDIATEVTKDVKEVLAPVPNYEEFQSLQEQLNEANAIITGEVHLVKRKDDTYVCECPEIVNYKEKWGLK